MKQYVWLLTAIIITFFLASCRQASEPSSWSSQELVTPVATMAPTPALPTPEATTAIQPTAVPAPTKPPTKPIPTLSTISNRPPARLVIERDAAASTDQEAVYRLMLYEAKDFFGIQFDLKFDPAKITFVDSDDGLPGVQITQGEAFPRGKSFVAINKVEQGLGTLEFAATRVSPLEELDGQVHVASIALLTEGDADAALEFGQVLLSDHAANSLPVAPEDIVVGNGS